MRLPHSDVNISVERRNRTHKSLSLTMVSAVAHVWFNAFFEGSGPERHGNADANGVFSIDWDAMDGIKGSSRKGSRALDRMAVVWRAVDAGDRGEEVDEPAEGQPVAQAEPANWKGVGAESGKDERDLGLRVQSEASEDVSRASSVKSVERNAANGDADIKGVRSSGPRGEDWGSK